PRTCTERRSDVCASGDGTNVRRPPMRSLLTKVPALSALALVAALVGCGKKEEPAAPAAASAAAPPAATTAAGKTITLCWAAWDPANALVELSKDFTAQTKVNMK